MKTWLAVSLTIVSIVAIEHTCPADQRETESTSWRYVTPPLGEPFAYPPLRAISLSDQRPADLEERITYRGKKQRYAQLRYGSPSSVRISIVVDEIGPNDVDLYVDARRNRAIEPADKVSGDKLTWRVPVEVAVVEGDILKLVPRTVIFRYGRLSRTLGYATCGYVEGQAKVGGQNVAVRRVDGDGNGFLNDPQDRLWLDLDGRGRWDPLEDQFPFAPLLTLGGERFVVRSDPLGKELSFAKLEGTGTVRLNLPALAGGEVEDMAVTLVSRDGIAATLQGKTAEATLPIGEYRCSTLLLTLKDRRSGQAWGYIFSDNDALRQEWHPLAKDGVLTVNPVGNLVFTSPAGDAGTCVAGERLQFRPGLYTGEGLLITTVYFGRELRSGPIGNGPEAKIALLGADGRKLDETTSGFA